MTPDETGRAGGLTAAARHFRELADRADRECIALYGYAKWFLPFAHDGADDVEGAMEDLMATFSPTCARAVADLLDAVAVQVAEVESLGLAPVPGHQPTGMVGAALAVAEASR